MENADPPVGCSPEHLEEALEHLKSGGVVAIPTDTLFGLAADVLSEPALEKVFNIKGRPADMALPVLVSDWVQVGKVAEVSDRPLRELVSAFWPGSLTLVLPRRSDLSPLVTGGRDTVAVRMPGHWVPLTLASELGRPITGTSANLSGHPNLESVQELREQLGDSVGAVIAEGPEPAGIQSTIVDLTGHRPVLLREGATPFDSVLRAWESITACKSALPEKGV